MIELLFSFLSPYGDYGSYRQYVSKEEVYRGAMFPSPYGDCGSYLSSSARLLWFSLMQFPSPYGDCGSYLSYPDFIEDFDVISFRPLTGIVVLIDNDKRTGNFQLRCFRPLTGIVVLIGFSSAGNSGLVSMFPSPYGDCGSYQGDDVRDELYCRFPSPYGDCGSYLFRHYARKRNI